MALPVAAVAWLLAGMSQGGWKVNDRWISNWCWRSLAFAVVLGLAVFLLLPKVEVETMSHPSGHEEEAAVPQTSPFAGAPVSSCGRNSLSEEPCA